jgi:hypothetical protein
MTLPVILAIAGCAALLVGLFGGGVKAKELEVPKISFLPRILSFITGMVLIGISIWIPQTPSTEIPPTEVPPTEVPPTEIPPTEIPPTEIPPTEVPPTPTPLPRIVGEWVNEDTNTRGITRIKIDYDGNTYSVETWGKCHPTDCYWNDYDGVSYSVSDATDSTITIAWIFDFKETALNIEALPDGRLEVLSHNHYTDNSGRSDRDDVYYFVKDGG